MSVSYLVMPFDSQMAEWAEKCEVPVDAVVPVGRSATFVELQEIAAAMPAHRCHIWKRDNKFQISLESGQMMTFPCDGVFKNTIAPGVATGPATSAHINGAVCTNGEVEWMSFHGDFELLVAIVRKLTSTCGPQVYVADCDGIPWLIVSVDAMPIGPKSQQGV